MDSGPKQTAGEPSSRPARAGAAGPDAATIGQTFDAARQNHRQGRMAEAEKLYRQVLAADPNHVDALHMLGVLAYQTGRPQAATDLIGQAIALHGDNAIFHNNIGEAFRYLGRLDDAMAHFAKATNLDPDAAEGHMNLGIVLMQQSRLDEAIGKYQHALDLRPNYAEARLNLGVARMEQGKFEDAAGQFRQALSLNPNFPEALMNLGLVLQHRGELAEAVAQYRKALAARPNYPAALLNLGNALLEQGKHGEALECYQRCLALTARTATPTAALAPIDSIRHAVNRTRALYPAEEPCFMSLVRVNCWRSAQGLWRTLCAAALEQAGLSPDARLELLVRTGVSQWLGDDRAGLADALRAAGEASAAIGLSRSREAKNSRAYVNFLTNLLRQADGAEAPARAPGTPELAVVGDSHCLSFHGCAVRLDGVAYRTGGSLVMGCKAWHLANPRPNLYKWRFGAIVSTIPEGSPIVCCFGEIDCRLDEGILPYYRKTGGDLDGLISDQVGRYVAHVASAVAPRRLAPIFVGVPAPHLDALSPQHPDASDADKALLIDIVKAFNLCLRQAAAKHGYRMIDMFAISAGPDGKASGEQHIDDFHLKPGALDLALR
jgi:tetratricopeptide (TPR) repeat protein